MPRAGTVCKTFGCGSIARAGGRCPACASTFEAGHSSTTERGYGSAHQAARGRAVPAVETGTARCWRCGEPIAAGEAWDLGHDEEGTLRGPEHRSRCNRRAAGLRAHGQAWRPAEERTEAHDDGTTTTTPTDRETH